MSPNHLALFLGLGFSMTGVFAFADSETFFGLLGEHYGAFNKHFVKDAGLSFLSCGVLLLLSTVLKVWQVPLVLGGSLFVTLHGVFHIHMLLMGMAPTGWDVAKELFVIILPSALTFVLFVWVMWLHRQKQKMARLTQ